MKRSQSMTWVQIACLVLVLAGSAAPALATPVLGLDDRGGTTESAMPGGLSRSTAPETSTGNKNLDLLLELQDKSGGDGAVAANGASAAALPSPASAARAAAAAKALAVLRAQAAEPPPAEGARSRQALPTVGGLGLLGDDAGRVKPAERREWDGQVGGTGGVGGAGGAGSHFDSPRESGHRGPGDHELLDLPRQVIAYLRDNRYWVLGSIAFLVLLGFALKAYSRRV